MLSHEGLYTLEHSARIRPEFRAKVVAHKKHRRPALGEPAALYFEDALTMLYPVQEMLRLERMFEADLIQGELDGFNSLIPDGHNCKATFMIRVSDVQARRQVLARLAGSEDTVWVRVAGFDKMYPFADEDLDRSTPDKTASVHFLRFERAPERCRAMKSDAALVTGIDHPGYLVQVEVPTTVSESLADDLI